MKEEADRCYCCWWVLFFSCFLTPFFNRLSSTNVVRSNKIPVDIVAVGRPSWRIHKLRARYVWIQKTTEIAVSLFQVG